MFRKRKSVKDYSIVDVKELDRVYRSRGYMKSYVVEELKGKVSEEFLQLGLDRIDRGEYDKDWEVADSPKLERLVRSILNAWESRPGSAWE